MKVPLTVAKVSGIDKPTRLQHNSINRYDSKKELCSTGSVRDPRISEASINKEKIFFLKDQVQRNEPIERRLI
jgi:hypothetical protein